MLYVHTLEVDEACILGLVSAAFLIFNRVIGTGYLRMLNM